MKKIYADQGLPYKLMKNKFFHRQEYKELIYIVSKNIPGLSPEEIIQMFKKLSDTGCSCAMLADSLVEQIYQDDNSFRETFGFSLITKDKIDCNKLMVDIFSKLYNVMKFRFVEYSHYSFDSVKEATEVLLDRVYSDENEAIIALFNSGFVSDGLDNNAKLLFKERKPKITNCVGTCEQIAKQKFGINGIKDLDTLKKICLDKNIQLEYKDIEIYQKLTGLGTENFNFWSNYYLSQYNVDFEVEKESIIISDFNSDYNSFINYINKLILDGYTISVSASANSQAYMHTNKDMSWSKISSEESGHVMLFKCFNDAQDIVVSSYGEDYIIPKEYFNILEFKKMKKIEKYNELEGKKRV